MVKFSAPGKLFISGEWAILEMGNKGMVAAVNSRVHATVDALAGYDGISVTAEEFRIADARAKYLNGRLVFMNLDDKSKEILKLLSESISVSLRYLEEHKIKFRPFKISTSSKELQIQVGGESKKVGFGSSAAVVEASIAAILDYHSYKFSKEEIYKLAAIAHYYGQGKIGSAFDVAASAYGGLFVYSRFDPKWLQKKIDSKERLTDIVKDEWPGFLVEELKIPESFRLVVGWTRTEASTSDMVKKMNEFKQSNNKKYSKLIGEVASCAGRAISMWEKGDTKSFLKEVEKNRKALHALGEASGLNIETDDLKKLAEIAASEGAAGKLSGAGGGDCGIAVCFSDPIAKNVRKSWEKSNIHIVDATTDRNGVRKE